MVSDELKVIVLVPVLEGQLLQRRGVGKLEVCEVPVENLTVFR